MGVRQYFTRHRTVKVGNYKLAANHGHQIEAYLKHIKYYSRNFPRIARYIEDKYPSYTIIDVGANIGDTIALLRTAGVAQPVHAIEGDPTYVGFLKKNLPLLGNVTLHEVFSGEHTRRENVAIENYEGTARISVGKGAYSVDVVKLDDLVSAHAIENVKLLKIDTDGFDFKIIRGASETIKSTRPVIFTEYDAVFLEQQQEDGLSIFTALRNWGYNKILYYDNMGKFILATELDKTELLEHLYAYIDKKESAFPYYDICIFHQDDNELASACIDKELEFYRR